MFPTGSPLDVEAPSSWTLVREEEEDSPSTTSILVLVRCPQGGGIATHSWCPKVDLQRLRQAQHLNLVFFVVVVPVPKNRRCLACC